MRGEVHILVHCPIDTLQWGSTHSAVVVADRLCAVGQFDEATISNLSFFPLVYYCICLSLLLFPLSSKATSNLGRKYILGSGALGIVHFKTGSLTTNFPLKGLPSSFPCHRQN